MEAEFRALMEAAMGRGVGGATLRLWCPQGARINFVRQVAPDALTCASISFAVDSE